MSAENPDSPPLTRHATASRALCVAVTIPGVAAGVVLAAVILGMANLRDLLREDGPRYDLGGAVFFFILLVAGASALLVMAGSLCAALPLRSRQPSSAKTLAASLIGAVATGACGLFAFLTLRVAALPEGMPLRAVVNGGSWEPVAETGAAPASLLLWAGILLTAYALTCLLLAITVVVTGTRPASGRGSHTEAEEPDSPQETQDIATDPETSRGSDGTPPASK